ncbi:hypothetical protein Peur_067886 [Populus x canadensis]
MPHGLFPFRLRSNVFGLYGWVLTAVRFILITVTDMLARPLCSKSVCDMSEVWGRNWTWKLQLRQCQNLTRIKWFGSFAMIVERPQKCSSMYVVAQKYLNCKSYNTRQTRG